MPSIPSADGSRLPVLLVVVASLAVVLPATSVAGHASPATGVTGPGPADDGAASEVADRSLAGDRACSPAPERGSGAQSSANRSSSAGPVASPGANETGNATVHLGDVAAVALSVPPGENVAVELGSNGGYHADLRVGDDGDGRVTLLVNTFVAANRSTVAPETFRAQGADEVTVTGGLSTPPLQPGEYPVTVRHDGSVVAERRLTVREPAVNGITVRRAAPRVFDAPNASAIRDANRSGLVRPLRPGEQLAKAVLGETLLLRIDAPSLLGVLAAQPGNTTTERFLALHRDHGARTPVTFSLTGPCGGIFFVESAEKGAARVVSAPDEGAIYVLMATDRLEAYAPTGGALLRIDPESPLGREDKYREADFDVTDRQLTVRNDSGTVRLAADDGATVAGETNLVPGSRVSVRVESRLDPSFERRTNATVAENGSFVAALDLSNASEPDVFEVTVDGEQYHGEVGNPPDVYWDVENPASAGDETLSIHRLELPDEGFLVAYEYDPGNGEFRPLGSARYYEVELETGPLPGDQHVLIVANRDGNDNDEFDGPATDPPYRVGGRPVVDWVAVGADEQPPPEDHPSVVFDPAKVETPTETHAESPTPTPTDGTPTTESPTRTAGEESSPTAPATGTGTDRTGVPAPGFGLSTAMLAFVCGAWLLLARRR